MGPGRKPQWFSHDVAHIFADSSWFRISILRKDIAQFGYLHNSCACSQSLVWRKKRYTHVTLSPPPPPPPPPPQFYYKNMMDMVVYFTRTCLRDYIYKLLPRYYILCPLFPVETMKRKKKPNKRPQLKFLATNSTA